MIAATADASARRATIACLAALGVFALCAVAMRTGLAEGVDDALLHWTHAQSTPALDACARWLAVVGYRGGVVPFDALLVLVLALRKHWRPAGFATVALGGGLLLNKGLKLLFARPRPALDWSAATLPASFSFPSGHAMATATLATVLTMLAWRSRWRWPVVGTAWGFALSAAVSRVVLGVHFPSDVLAGMAVGVAWASAVRWAFARRAGAVPG